MISQEYTNKGAILGRVPYGDDLITYLEGFIKDNSISTGVLWVIGAVSKASLGFYDQQAKKYSTIVVDKPLEIAGCMGNISIKDGTPMIHAHIIVSDQTGATYGGHLMQGTKVFASEFCIMPLLGRVLERKPDEVTGLTLWA